MKKTIIILLAISLTGKLQAQKSSIMNHTSEFSTQLQEVYTVFVTKDIRKSKSFYSEWFGFTPIFESSWFILLRSPGEKGFLLAFMNEEHPSSPPNPKAMKGDGAFITFQVADAKKVYDAIVAAGKKVDYQLKDEDWGQRRFALVDPNGMHVDVVEQTTPKAGFWDKYMQ